MGRLLGRISVGGSTPSAASLFLHLPQQEQEVQLLPATLQLHALLLAASDDNEQEEWRVQSQQGPEEVARLSW